MSDQSDKARFLIEDPQLARLEVSTQICKRFHSSI